MAPDTHTTTLDAAQAAAGRDAWLDDDDLPPEFGPYVPPVTTMSGPAPQAAHAASEIDEAPPKQPPRRDQSDFERGIFVGAIASLFAWAALAMAYIQWGPR